VFARSREKGIVRDNPCVGIKRNEESPRERLVTDVELLRWCKAAYRSLRLRQAGRLGCGNSVFDRESTGAGAALAAKPADARGDIV